MVDITCEGGELHATLSAVEAIVGIILAYGCVEKPSTDDGGGS